MIAYRIQAIDPATGQYFFVDDYGFLYERTAYSVISAIEEDLQNHGIDMDMVTVVEYLHL